jgi:hypothetical protein
MEINLMKIENLSKYEFNKYRSEVLLSELSQLKEDENVKISEK